MRIAVDLDGVCFNFQDHWVNLYREWWGVDLTGQATEWDSHVNLTHFETSSAFFSWFEAIKGYETQPWIDGARGALVDLEQADHSITFATSRRGDEVLAQTKRSLGFCLTPRRALKFNLGNGKHVVSADVWVDDSPEVIRELIKNKKRVIKFAQPWNKDIKKHSLLSVANNWKEVVEQVKEMQS